MERLFYPGRRLSLNKPDFLKDKRRNRMYSTPVTIIFSLLILVSVENSVVCGQVWLKPNRSVQGRVFCNFNRQMKIVTGDTLSDRVRPYFTMEKWGDLDNPATLSAWLRIRQFNTDPDSVRIDGDSIFVFGDFQSQAIYTLDDGLEWTIFLRQKPISNALSYQIFSSNLSFLYQGELTRKEIERNANRPDSVVGSYAVYHSSRAHNEYKTGKVFHIYRPEAWDANGDTVWCDLNIDTINGILSLTLPIDFWDNASYPIVIDPHFGYDTMGASEVGVTPSWTYASLETGDYYTAATGDNVDSLFVGIRSPNASGDDMAMAIYDIDKGAPDTKIMESDRFAASNTKAWYGIAVNQPLTNGVTYCIAAGEFSAGIWWFAYDAQTDGASENGSSFPDIWSGVNVNHHFSMYAVYSTTGGGSDVSPRRRKIPENSGVDR